MKRLLIGFMALVLAIASPQPVAAWGVMGHWISTGAIDGDGDGKYDITVCFGAIGQEVFNNRATLLDHLENETSRYVVGDDLQDGRVFVKGFASSAECDGDGSVIQIKMVPIGVSCAVGGRARDLNGNLLVSQSYSSIQIQLNTYCAWDWSGETPNNAHSAAAVILHEFGHAWRLQHSLDNGAVMHDGGPDHCPTLGNTFGFDSDDAAGLRNSYSGILDANGIAPLNASCWT